MFNKVLYEGIAEMGKNPASVEMGTGNLILNKDTFPFLPQFTQKFVIEHEKGHLNLNTDNEQLADEYAINSLYKTEKKSLKKSVKALVDILPDDDPRIESMYNKALELDKGVDMARMNMYNFLTEGNGMRSRRYNADGDESGDEVIIEEDNTPVRRKRYLKVFGYSVTLAELIFLIICLLAIFKYLK